MAERLSLYDWLRQDSVLGYIINAYAGVEPVASRPGVLRRVYLWEEEHEVKMGNTEAFMLHLGRRFDRKVVPADASALHELLRELGESIAARSGRAQRDENSPRRGRFQQPKPDEWVIRHKPE